jgi:Alpha/beta hydrolase domain
LIGVRCARVIRPGALGVLIVLLVTSGLFTQESGMSAGAATTTAGPAANIPTVTGPVTGGQGRPTVITTSFDLADVGYTSAEYFLEGTATAYTSAQPLTADGRWSVTPQATAPYKTRIVVYRPTRRAEFNGTVFVEWLNVSPGRDNAPDWLSGHNAIIGDGAAWIGVSAPSG